MGPWDNKIDRSMKNSKKIETITKENTRICLVRQYTFVHDGEGESEIHHKQ